ncbi:MAG: transporter [Desulfobacterales bacterium]|nr:transporter [Desulfobacterales bacterium]
MKRHANRSPLVIILIMAAILFPVLAGPAQAAESAGSSYTPGTYGDFTLNYAPPGLYVRENVIYYAGEIDDYPVAPGVEAKMDQTVWADLLVITYISDKKLLGGNYFCVFNIPYGFSADLDVEVLGMNLEDSTSGLGDIQVVPLGLMWNSGYFHFTLSENIVLKSGEYNQKNEATDYRTGNEFHVDATVAQYFSESFGVGVVGYYYKQVTADASPGLVNEYKGEGLGVGPAVMWSPAKDFQIIAKWINEVDAENRFQGDFGFLSANLKF